MMKLTTAGCHAVFITATTGHCVLIKHICSISKSLTNLGTAGSVRIVRAHSARPFATEAVLVWRALAR